MLKKCSVPAKNTWSFIRRAFSLTLAVLTLCASLSACDSRSVEAETVTPTPILPTPTPEILPIEGGELRLPMPVNADASDPLKVNTEEMQAMFSLIFESLVACDSTNRIVPLLAEKWSVDESGRKWTFTLRKGIKWHNTDMLLSAQDVKYTVDRLAAMTEESYYSFVTSHIEACEVVDDNTVAITMRQQGMGMLYFLMFPIMCSQQQDAVTPSGTGPYAIASATRSQVKLTVNKQWWKQLPYITDIYFLARDNNDTALASYSAGQLNMVPTSSLSAGRYREEGVTSVLNVMTQDMETLLINHNTSVLKDVRVRQAIAYAIDRNELIPNVYMNCAFASDVPVPPDSWAYDGKSKVYDHDKQKAIALFDEAGFADVDDDGFLEYKNNKNRELTFKLLVNDTTDVTARKDVAAIIAAQLEKAGVHIEIIAAPFSITAETSEYVDMLQNGEFDLALAGFNIARNNDLSAYINRNGARNYGKFYDSETERLLSTWISAGDEKSYRDAASAFQIQFSSQLPFITLYFRMNSIIYSSDVKGLTDVREPDIFKGVEKWYINTAA